MINKKGMRIAILILLIAVAICCFSLLIMNFFFKNKEHKETMVETHAVVPHDKSGSTQYINGTININNQSEFNSFVSNSNATTLYSENVGNWGSDIKYYYNYNYGSATVVLNCNVTLSTQITRICGTFNGNGHTITCTETFTSNNILNLNAFGSVIYNTGTIKNTKFKDVFIYIENSTTDFNGGIVGQNDGTITSCIVENFSCKSNRDDGDKTVRCGPLAGYNAGTITNCMVNGNYTIGGVDDGWVQEGVWAAYFVGRNSEATNSIFTANVSKSWLTTDTHAPSEWDSGAFSGTNCSSCSSAYVNITSDISTATGPTGTAWYKYATLSHGYGSSPYYNDGTTIYYYNVYLRVFISWPTISFSAGEGGSVSHSSVTVPSEYQTVTKSGNKATVYTTTVTATPDAGYEFKSWSGNQAQFQLQKVKLSFADASNCSESSSTISLGTEYYIAYNGSISVVYTYYSNSKIKSVKFSFTDYGGTSRSITYTASNAYYISTNNLTTSTSIKITSVKTGITVTAAKKTYSIGFN